MLFTTQRNAFTTEKAGPGNIMEQLPDKSTWLTHAWSQQVYDPWTVQWYEQISDTFIKLASIKFLSFWILTFLTSICLIFRIMRI